MPDETLLTLRQLAAQLALPESTIRYYRDAFLDHIPSVGTGRRRRYPSQAVAVLRSIARSYASGQSRGDIARALEQHAPRPATVATAAQHSAPTRAMDEVSNLDLLGAILDGEREQRDALWQMAKEIVRLTGVLEGQDKVLGEIADRAGVVVSGRPAVAAPAARPALSAPNPMAEAAPAPAAVPLPPPAPPAPHPQASAFQPPPPMPPPPPPVVSTEPVRIWPEPSPVAEPPMPAPPAFIGGNPFSGGPLPELEPEPPASPFRSSVPAAPMVEGGEMERLRQELESERALVERLREAKLQLEHRTADAESALENNRGRRSSVIKRLLTGEKGDDR